MENSNLIIRIPEPCHEDWNKMLPDEKGLPTGQAGKFCNSCNKSVHDFSNKTDAQIKDILMQNQGVKMCGHFKKTQIDRPLSITIDLNNLPRNISVTKMFTIALFIAFGTLLFSCTDNLGKTVGEISIVEPPKKETNQEVNNIVGQMVAMPNDSLQTIEKIDPIETVEGEMSMHYESHVSGGISMQYVDATENIIQKDSNVVDSPIVELPKIQDHIVGMMVYIPITEDKIPTQLDTISIIPDNADDVITDIKSDFIVYPNPTKGEFTIRYDLKKRSDILIDIVDINGVTLRTIVNVQGQHNGKYQVPVNLSDLTNGIYFVNLTNDGKRKTQKVILEK